MRLNNDFSKSIDILHRAMDASTIRREVIANNIANAGVPNYKRTSVNFESELKRALDSEKQRPALALTMTNEKHIPNWQEKDYQKVEPRRVLDYTSSTNANGNNVDIEEESMLSMQNQLMYILLAQAQTFQFGQLNLVLRS